jgi:hypothetical protein
MVGQSVREGGGMSPLLEIMLLGAVIVPVVIGFCFWLSEGFK